MPNTLILSPNDSLERNLLLHTESLNGCTLHRVPSSREACHVLSTERIQTVVVDFRGEEAEEQSSRLLDWLDTTESVTLPKLVAVSDRGFGRVCWSVVDRLVTQHVSVPFEPLQLAKAVTTAAHMNSHEHPQVRSIHIQSRRLEANGLRFTTRTPAMFGMIDQLERVATHDVTLLFIGETGTGKTYLGHLIHELSPRHGGPFFATACGALPPDLIESELFGHVKGAFTSADRNAEGRFSAASGGSLLLDEIDVLGPKEQSKLLRVIETGKYEPVGSTETKNANVRLIVASNVDLRDLAQRNQFRTDLYYRLNILEFHLLPLRERPFDILPMADRFIEESARTHGIEVSRMDAGFLQLLKDYHWPGNIRELQNQMRRAVLFSNKGLLTPNCLSIDRAAMGAVNGNRNGGQTLQVVGWNLNNRMASSEREILQETLRAHNNNRAATARALGISRTALYKKLHRFGLLHFGELVPQN